ncbi:MAG: hypothetical protein JXR51_13960 [Bacteroidales bacterium]|nr:hypothetical protein [Bacteroidales bacterium]
MNKFVLILCVLLLISNLIVGQTVILNEKPIEYDLKMPTDGPNFNHFNHLYLSYNFIIPFGNKNEIETNFGQSYIFNLGWRYKYKIAEFFAIGTALNFYNVTYNLAQNENKKVPNDILHKKEKIKFNNLGTEFFMRFNFGKRGNVIGRFIDLSSYVNYAISVKHLYQDPIDSNNNQYMAGVINVTLSDLSYVERLNYGVRARIGFNRWVITSSYRLSNLLKDTYLDETGDFEFPRFSLGFEIGLHK